MKTRKTLSFVVFAALICLINVFSANAKEIVVGFTGPLSGTISEYGEDISNGIDLAVRELNEAGGVVVQGQKYTFRLVKLDDRMNMTTASTNVQKMREQKAVAMFCGSAPAAFAMMNVNQEKGKEFLVMLYASTKITWDNKLMISSSGPLESQVPEYVNWAFDRGYRKLGIILNPDVYGKEWTDSTRKIWEKKGGVVTAIKPANYYREVDFSSQITAVLSTGPDVMLIGGPSDATALIIEQIRNMGFKGGFMIIDQVRLENLMRLLKGTEKKIGNAIIVAPMTCNTTAPMKAHWKKYKDIYHRDPNWESIMNYMVMHCLAKAIKAAQTADDVYAIRAALPKAYPHTADKYPTEVWGLTSNGRQLSAPTLVTLRNGAMEEAYGIYWWPKDKKEFDYLLKTSKYPLKFKWVPGIAQ